MALLRMDETVGETRLERSVQGLLGKGVDRYEGAGKATGQVRYAAEHPVPGELAYGFAITASVGRGAITRIDAERARAMPGVLAVIVDDPRIPIESAGFSDPKPAQGNRRLENFGQVVGVAIADSFEAARDAALAVEVAYAPSPGRFDPDAVGETEAVPRDAFRPDFVSGDIDRAMAEAEVTLDATWTTPSHIHNAMEPHASIAWWEGDKLTIYTSVQIVSGARAKLAAALGIDRHRIHMLAPHIGGGFGGKGGLGAEAVLAALGAEATGRPVRIALTRQQLFHANVRRSETRQHIRLAATRDGRLTAIGHDSTVSQKDGRGFFEPASVGTTGLYAAPNRHIIHRIARVDLPAAGAVRAPGEAVGMMALEAAMDEMAETLGLDPIAFRKLNEPAEDPDLGVPFSSRMLVECMDEGARRFGWDRRNTVPGARREGEWLVGLGMAAAVRGNFMADSTARARLTPDGRAVIETDMTDIGTGSYTILAQIAGELLGLPIEQIDVRLGDSDHPAAIGSGGSIGAASSGSSVALACEELVGQLARRMGAIPDDMTLKDGHAIAGNRRVPLGELLGGQAIEAEGTIKPGRNNQAYSQNGYGAQFAEVAVSAVTGEVRLRRMLGVFAAGRILNAKLARSQAIGGMIWGVGSALTEEAVVDPRFGAFVNHDLAEYHVPVNADIRGLDAIFLDESDDKANPLKIKGIGELGISGAGAAISNAVYNATGARVRDYPITLDKLLPHLPNP